jgi:hypothetical protein
VKLGEYYLDVRLPARRWLNVHRLSNWRRRFRYDLELIYHNGHSVSIRGVAPTQATD